MSTEKIEILVILEPDAADATLQGLHDQYHVLQVFSPTMVLMLVDEDDIPVVKELEGVSVVHDSEIPEEEFPDWKEEESLFGQAWNLRQQSFDKSRKGDGLEWNAEGFEAPDAFEEE